MFPLIFCGLCVQKLWRVRTFLGIYPELNAFLCPKLGEDQKKGLNQKWSGFCDRNYVKTIKNRKKKDLQPELERFLCPKSLLSVFLL